MPWDEYVKIAATGDVLLVTNFKDQASTLIRFGTNGAFQHTAVLGGCDGLCLLAPLICQSCRGLVMAAGSAGESRYGHPFCAPPIGKWKQDRMRGTRHRTREAPEEGNKTAPPLENGKSIGI